MPYSSMVQPQRNGCYGDLAHQRYQDIVRQQISATVILVDTATDFSKEIAIVHENFAEQLHLTVERYQRRTKELIKQRPTTAPSTTHSAWQALLDTVESHAHAQTDTAEVMRKTLSRSLQAVGNNKRTQAEQIYQFRANLEAMLIKAKEKLELLHEQYSTNITRYSGIDSAKSMVELANAHNQYVLQIHAINAMREAFFTNTLPCMLEELEEVQIDLSNVLSGVLESYCLLQMTQGSEQRDLFESVITHCKKVSPKDDVDAFVKQFNPSLAAHTWDLEEFNAVDCNHSEFIDGNELYSDRMTTGELRSRYYDLRKDMCDLNAQIQSNHNTTVSLMNTCQKNLANQLYGEAYKTQTELSQKRNEINAAEVQIAGIRAQMELLNTKNNGAVDDQNKAAADQNASIKGLWKWAFSSLRKDKPPEQTKDPARKGRKPQKGKPGECGEEGRETDADIDPVYHLLKCAANKGQYCATCGGPKQPVESGPPMVPPNSGCSSPASASSGPCATCKCPCHSPHRIPSITTKDIAPQRKKGRTPQPNPTGGTPGSYKGTSPTGGPTLTISQPEDFY